MIPPTPAADDLLETLRGLLDEEIALLDLRRSQLSSLCGAIVDRDEDAVERLLEQIEQAQQLQTTTDGKLRDVRGRLADVLGWESGEVRLSALILHLPAERQPDLIERRERIIRRAEALQLEHLRTVVLLSECARINRLLLASLCPETEGVTTYSAAGADDWRGDAGVLDTER